LEKLLLEACVEAMHTGAVVGIQDMGAAGLTCSTCEMGARGGVGLEIELDNVPQRETAMNSYEIMLSESQERMLLVAEKGREDEVLRVFAKWGLDAVVVGRVINDARMRVLHHGEVVADIPNLALTDEAPLYNRPMEPWRQTQFPREKPAGISLEGRDPLSDLKKLLASPNICSKRWIFEQYDSMVQTNTVEGPGADAGVMRIKGTKRGLAMSLDGNGRWCYLDPKLGAMHCVAEAARNVVCSGGKPVAATNCLNFGNPEKPYIMAQFSDVIDGLAEACNALGTPITGGNVSLYNETLGEGIYPTPVVGVVGIIDDIAHATRSHFQAVGRDVILLHTSAGDTETTLGSSEFAKHILGATWGLPPALDLNQEAALQTLILDLISQRLIESAHDCSDGGLAVALAECAFPLRIGAKIQVRSSYISGSNAQPTDRRPESGRWPLLLFGEAATRVLISCDPKNSSTIQQMAVKSGLVADLLGQTQKDKLGISVDGKPAIAASVLELKQVWGSALERALHLETPEHVVPEVLQKS
ncbi:MAG TPA: AIR synthase-related protein, partial [Terriglobales bacterium]|nr:AIR synthase-related protein [Terriglobales bacterium]